MVQMFIKWRWFIFILTYSGFCEIRSGQLNKLSFLAFLFFLVKRVLENGGGWSWSWERLRRRQWKSPVEDGFSKNALIPGKYHIFADELQLLTKLSTSVWNHFGGCFWKHGSIKSELSQAEPAKWSNDAIPGAQDSSLRVDAVSHSSFLLCCTFFLRCIWGIWPPEGQKWLGWVLFSRKQETGRCGINMLLFQSSKNCKLLTSNFSLNLCYTFYEKADSVQEKHS